MTLLRWPIRIQQHFFTFITKYASSSRSQLCNISSQVRGVIFGHPTLTFTELNKMSDILQYRTHAFYNGSFEPLCHALFGCA